MTRRTLGTQGLEVSAVGLGCMGMSALRGDPQPDTPRGYGSTDEAEAVATIQRALDIGVDFRDTADM